MADEWMKDERQIKAVKLAGNGEWFYRLACSEFERFERHGEYCMLPWVRIHDRNKGRLFEAPLTQVELIEYSETRNDTAG